MPMSGKPDIGAMLLSMRPFVAPLVGTRCASIASVALSHKKIFGRTLMRRRELLALGMGALSASALTASAAFAQSRYPERPIRLVIPYPPGGGYDATGRPWAEKAKSLLGTIVIENLGGAGSSLGTAAVARAQPDGHTILLAGNSGLVINPIAATRSPYDP